MHILAFSKTFMQARLPWDIHIIFSSILVFFLILNSEFRSYNLCTLSVTLFIEFVNGEDSCLFIGHLLKVFFLSLIPRNAVELGAWAEELHLQRPLCPLQLMTCVTINL